MLTVELAKRPAEGIAALLSRRGVAAKRAYDFSGNVDLLDAAVDDQTAAIEAGPTNEAARAVYEARLSNALCDRYTAGSDRADLDNAIRYANAAIESLHGASAERPGMEYTALGRSMALRYEQRHDGADLDAALLAFRQAIEQARSELPPWLELNNLADSLIRHEFQRTGDVRVLGEALDLLVEAAGFEPDPADLARVLNNWGLGLLTRFRATGQRDDLLEAVARVTRAVDLSPYGDTGRPKRLANLASGLLALGAIDGDVEALDKAVQANREVIAAVAPWSYDGSNYRVNLAAALSERYRLTGRRADLAEAEEICARISPAATVSWRVPILSNSAVTLLEVADATASPSLLAEAVRRLTEALELTEGDDPLRQAIVFNLSAALQTQGITLRRSDLIEAALGSLSSLLGDLPESHPIRPQVESALAAGRLVRGLVIKSPGDLSAAADLGEKALTAQDAHSEGWCASALLLASAYLAVDVPGWIGSQARAESLLRQVILSSPSPAQQIAAAAQLGGALDERSDQAGAAEAYLAGVRATESLFDRQATRSHQVQALRSGLGLATHAAVALASLGRVTEAVAVLEAGRTVLAGTALRSTRRQLDALVAAGHGDLADEYLAAAAAAAAASAAATATPSMGADPEARGSAAVKAPSGGQLRTGRQRLDQAIDRIALQPGFESFPRPGPLSQDDLDGVLATCVYLVPGQSGGVAIRIGGGARSALTPSLAPDWRPLPGLAEAALAERADAWDALVSSAASRAAPSWPVEVASMGRWLWDRCMATVVDLVGDSPEVVLIPCGRLVDLPLHAARHPGLRADSGQSAAAGEGDPTYVVSRFTVRYAPSLRSLIESTAAADRRADRMLAVADETLRHTVGEAEAAIATFETSPPAPRLKRQSTHAEIVAGLSANHVVHFACHAYFDRHEALASHVDACRDAPITLAEMLDLDLSRVRLVVLSACESALSDKSLPDEVVNLASALTQSGVAGVIGSLWPVADETTAILVERFYELWRGVGLVPAAALCRAQAEMASPSTGGVEATSLDPTRPQAWAPFVFYGA
jgi:tetratricopeptide (TPR) repeat protein